MKLLRILPLAFLFALGCGKAKEKTPAEKAVDDAEASANAFCKCAKEDTECMKKATAAGEASEAALEKEKLTPELQKRVDAITAKVQACAANEAPPEDTVADTGEQDKLFADMAALRDAACKCTDQACFDAAVKAGDTFEDRMKAIWKDEASMPADASAKVDAIKKAVEECATKIGSGQAPVAPPAGDPAAEATKVLDEMQGMADEICKCADMACAEPIGQKLNETEQKLHDLFPDASKVPPELMKRGEDMEAKVKDCVAKFAP